MATFKAGGGPELKFELFHLVVSPYGCFVPRRSVTSIICSSLASPARKEVLKQQRRVADSADTPMERPARDWTSLLSYSSTIELGGDFGVNGIQDSAQLPACIRTGVRASVLVNVESALHVEE